MKARVFINGKELKAGFRPGQRRDKNGRWTDEPDPKHEFDMYGRPAWQYALQQYATTPQSINYDLMNQEEFIGEQWLVDRLDYALTRLPRHKGVTHRSILLNTTELERFKNEVSSGELLFRAFTSTSKSRAFAENWDWGGYATGIKVLMTVNGKSGRDISEYTKNMNGGEVLFPRNTKWIPGPMKEWVDENTGEFYWELEITEK